MENRDILSYEETQSVKSKRNKHIFGAVISCILIIFVFWLIFGFLNKPRDFRAENYAQLMEKTPEITQKGVVVKINDINIGEDLWNYYFMREAEEYAYKNNVSVESIKWDEKVDDTQTALQKVKYNAMAKLVTDTSVNLKAKEWGISVTNEDRQIATDLDVQKQMLGDEAYERLGIEDEKSYFTIRDSLILKDKVRNAVSQDLKKYTKNIDLGEFANSLSATVKIIEIPIGERSISKENAKLKAKEIKERLEKGEDFDTVWLETAKATAVKLDDVQTPMVATIYKGTISDAYKNMEETALNLKVGETSEIVETDYSYVIIKRVEGYTEVLNMLVYENDISINKDFIEKCKIK